MMSYHNTENNNNIRISAFLVKKTNNTNYCYNKDKSYKINVIMNACISKLTSRRREHLKYVLSIQRPA